jgi:hypothetical protein
VGDPLHQIRLPKAQGERSDRQWKGDIGHRRHCSCERRVVCYTGLRKCMWRSELM